MARHNDIGRLGEDVAARFLSERGCSIVDRNARVGSDEIDLVVTDHGVLVAVEVKTSSNGTDPLSAADEAKLGRVHRAASGYRGHIARVDIIAVRIHRHGAQVHWMKRVE